MFKAAERYYLSTKANLQNSNSIVSYQIREKIESLREKLLEIFNWKERGNIAFLPNPYYSKITFLNYLLNKHKDKKIGFFSNSQKRDGWFLESLGAKVNYFTSFRELDCSAFDVTVYFFSELEKCENYPEADFAFNLRKRSETKFLVAEVLSEESKFVECSDMFMFTPLPGVTAMGYRNSLELEPVILGSNSVVSANKIKYEISDSIFKFESGTLHLPLLLTIESFYNGDHN